MKKVGILTINDNSNYGNRLQNYAVQEVLKREKVNAYTIINNTFIKPEQKKTLKILATKVYNKFRFLLNKYDSRNIKRSEKFAEFNKNIDFYDLSIDVNSVSSDLDKDFDCFFCGSDQIWNPNFGRMSDIDFLTFAQEKKRNSFSASFGINDIPDNLTKYYKSRLLGLNNISVREDRAKELVENLTGRTDTVVLVDPTMLLSIDDWNKVLRKPENLNATKYILNYFLGELSEERKKEINRIAKENNCEVINILDKNSPFYGTGPSEFLYLEKHAFLICTDSFHSSVFAIIYNKPFIIFDREQKNVVCMNSRIETLLTKFKLKDRKFSGKITKENLQHDYTEAYKILEKERKKSKAFLERALDIKK